MAQSLPVEFKVWDNASSPTYNMTHRHSGIELHYCKAGTGSYQIAGDRLPMLPGRVTLLWAPMTHQIVARGNPYCRSVIHFPANMLLSRLTTSESKIREILPDRMRPCFQFILPPESRPAFDTIFSALFRERKEAHSHAYTAVCLYLTQLFLILARSELVHTYHGSPTTPHEERLAEQIEHLVEQSSNPSISVVELASSLQLSQGHIWRVYKKVRGVSIRDLLNGRRLNIASNLLRQGFTVTETALACHFSDTSNFSRFFKRHTGMSPSSYKKANQEFEAFHSEKSDSITES